MINTELLKAHLEDITPQTFKDAIFLCYKDGITSMAPLGYSGDTILLHGTEKGGRVSQVSVRNYSGDAELLITDTRGAFLFYGRYRIDLGIEFVAEQYWQIFTKVYHNIEDEVPRKLKLSDIKLGKNCEYSEGFEIMALYQKLTMP